MKNKEKDKRRCAIMTLRLPYLPYSICGKSESRLDSSSFKYTESTVLRLSLHQRNILTCKVESYRDAPLDKDARPMKKTKIDWKQNLRKIPDWILSKAKGFKMRDVVVACVKKIPVSAIEAGKYAHLSIAIKNSKPIYPSSIIPPESVGKFSNKNVNGLEIVRRDLPMTTMTASWEAPDYGDWSRGSHEISMDRDVYQRDFISPRLLEIRIELIAEELKQERLFVFKFTVNEVLDSSSRSLKATLLDDLNLLQENVGVVDIFQSDATLDDYLKTIYVHWEILPPGERDETINRIFSGFRTDSEEVRQKLISRYDLLSKLNPIAFISGTSGFRRYFGAKFADNLVVFENLEYGNAVYVMFEGWEKLSKMSRIDLLSGDRKGFVRIVHRSGWQNELKKIVLQKR